MSQFEGNEFSQDIQAGANTARQAVNLAKSVKKGAKGAVAAAKAVKSAVQAAKAAFGGKALIIIGVAVLLLIVLTTLGGVPLSALNSEWGMGQQSSEEFGTVSVLQEQYETLKTASAEKFEVRVQSAWKCATDAAEDYEKDLVSKYSREYDEVSVVESVVRPHEKSPVQAKTDLTSDLFLMFSLYDTHRLSQISMEEVESAYIGRMNEIRESTGTLSAEDSETLMIEAEAELLPEITVDAFLAYVEAKANDMFIFELPTKNTRFGLSLSEFAKCPVPIHVPNGTAEEGPYAGHTIHTYTREISYTTTVTNDDGTTSEETVTEIISCCDISYNYEWLLTFDGVSLMAKDFGWVIQNEDGTLTWTEEGQELYEQAVQKAQAYLSLIQGEDLYSEDGILIGTSYSGSMESAILEYLESEEKAYIYFDGKFEKPLDFTKADITSGVGYRGSIAGNPPHVHKGIDIGKVTGTPIFAPTDGVVIAKGYTDGLGNHFIIYSGDYAGTSYFTIYAHCSRVDVSVNDQVKTGDLIAAVGATGRVTGPHLHFCIYTVSEQGRVSFEDPEKHLF